MAIAESRLRHLVKVAQLYYEDDLNQEEISARLQLSRTKVARLLQEARRIGIVQIRVVAPHRTSLALERRLERVFGLHQAANVEAGESGQTEAQAIVRR